jgi:Ca-activated chloride channel family protein
MTLAAMTPVEAALLAAAITAAIVALYLLKRGQRRVIVSSSVLWRRVFEGEASRSFIERFRTVISILLAVTIALLIALAIARPQVPLVTRFTGAGDLVAVVLDTSPSMAARTADGATRWRHAVDQARQIVDRCGASTRYIIADTSGGGYPSAMDRGEARAQIDRLSPSAAVPAFPALPFNDATVYYVTDGIAMSEPRPTVRRVSVFEPADNVAITAFSVRPVPAAPLDYEAYLEVSNYGRPSTVDLTITGAGHAPLTRTLRLSTGQQFKEAFDLSGFAGGPVEARIRSKNDALAIDDVGYGYLPDQRKTRTLLVTRGNKYLETVLSLDRHVEVRTVDPASFREQDDVDLYVFDRFAPGSQPARPALVIGAPAAPWLPASKGVAMEPDVTKWAADHPLMQYVSIRDVSVERAARVDAGDLTVVAGSSDVPLILASAAPRLALLTFELGASDFPLHAGFPIFIENTLAWFGREPAAISPLPGLVDIPIEGAEVKSADQRIIPSQPLRGTTAARLTAPGLYTATRGSSIVRIAVNLTSPELSNINRRSTATSATNAPPVPTRWLHQDLWFYMLLAAAALAAAEWVTYHRRVTL